MSFSVARVLLRIANASPLRRAFRLANEALRPERPVGVRLAGHRIYAATLDRIAALWMRKWTAAERFHAKLWAAAARPGLVVADVGANLGVYALLAARGVGPTGEVHAFEPDPENCALLRRSIAANGYEANVTVHEAAVADRVGPGTLYRRLEHRGDHRIYPHDGGGAIPIRVTTLDQALGCGRDARGPSRRLDLVKLDIQGAEWRAVEGMRGLVAANPQLAFFTEFWPEGLARAGGDPRRFLEAARDLGLSVRTIDDERGRLLDLADAEVLDLCRSVGSTHLLLAGSRAPAPPTCPRPTPP